MKKYFLSIITVFLLMSGCASPTAPSSQNDTKEQEVEETKEPETMEVEEETEVELEENQASGGF